MIPACNCSGVNTFRFFGGPPPPPFLCSGGVSCAQSGIRTNSIVARNRMETSIPHSPGPRKHRKRVQAATLWVERTWQMMAFSRYMRNMKTIFLVPFLLVSTAWADEAADRASIARTIPALNDPGQRAGVFAKGANPVTEILRLVNAFPPLAHLALGQLEPPSSDTRFTVVISHEPWGEATIWPVPSGIAPAVPQVESGPIQFLNPNVALVEGTADRKST